MENKAAKILASDGDQDHLANIEERPESERLALFDDLEAQLEQNVKDLVETQRIAHIGTWRLNLATNQVVWSEELYKMYGFDPTLPPPPYTEHMKLFTPESWDQLSTALEQTRTFGIPYELELKTVTKDGSNGWMWVRGEAEKNQEGQIVTIWGAAQDITERKKTEHEIRQSEERFQLLFNRAPLGYQSLDFEGRFIEVNQKWLDTLGYNKEEVIGQWFGDFLCPEYVDGFRRRFPLFKAQGYIQSEFEMLSKDGQRVTIAFEGKVGYGADGAFKQTHCIMRDITEQKRAEAHIRQQNELFTSLLKLLPVGVFMVDAVDGKPLVVNEMGIALLGSGILPDANEHNLSEAYKAYKGDTRNHYPIAEMPIALGMKGISAHIDDMVVERPDGSRILLEVFGTPVKDQLGKPWASLVTFMDISERKKAERELIYLSYHDHLTDFYNRRFFEKELKRLDTTTNLPLSIIMCDINGLKLINDSFGHDFGDKLLIKAAETIKKACRADDIIARIGGDEFAVLLPRTDAAETLKIANRIKRLAAKVEVANIELSISCGYDVKQSENQKMIEVLANAENYMYRHKLYERSSMRSKTIDIIMNTLFEKSDRESLHSSRVSGICKAIALKMAFDKDDINKIGIAGLVHDIGKIGIDEKILNKAGSLSCNEKEQIKRHPEIGWRILSSANELSELAKFILNHHESWDGSGYPNGLKGDEIPLEARIIAVADAYDAMTSERSYREALSEEEAVKELRRCSGTQFDPRIVEVFAGCIAQYHDDFGHEGNPWLCLREMPPKMKR